MYTMNDVAKAANVSLGTVSNYINKTKPIKKATGIRIQQAIDDLGFTPNYAAKMLKTNITRDIGVILPTLKNPYYVSILEGIESVLHAEGYQLSLVLTNEIPHVQAEAIRDFSRKCHSGILMISCDPYVSTSDVLEQKNMTVPIFFIERMPTSTTKHFLGYDYTRTMTYLIESIHLNNPMATIGLITGNPSFSSESECIQSYLNASSTASHINCQNFILHTNSTKEDAFKSSLHFLHAHSFDYIITTSEPIAEGLLAAANFLSIPVPDRMQIISFGEDLLFSDIKHNDIIRTSRMAHKLGVLSTQRLLHMISPTYSDSNTLQTRLQDKIIYQSILNNFSNRTSIVQPIAPPSLQSNSSIQKGHIRIALLNEPITKSLIPVLTNFTQLTGIEVTLDFYPQEELLELLLTSTTNRPYMYDILMYDIPWFTQLASQHVLVDLSSRLSAWHFDTSIFIPGLFKQLCCYQESILGLPFLFSSQVMLYRKDLFEDLVLKQSYAKKFQRPLQVPTQWKEFNQLAEFFTQSINPTSPVPFGTAIACETQEILIPEFLTRLWGNKGKLFNQQTQWTITTPEFYHGLYDFLTAFLYTPSDVMSYSIEATVDLFIEGKTAMLITYTSYLHKLFSTPDSFIQGKYDFVQVPGNNPLVGGWGLGISSSSKQVDESFAFLNWVCGKELSHYFTLLEGQSPHKEVYDNDELINHYPWLSLVNATKENPQLRRVPFSSHKKVIPIPEIERILYQVLLPLIIEIKKNQSLDELDLSIKEAIHLIHQQLSDLFRAYGY